jgi:SP family myo-inositol transporter-like MFS transporter 13
MPFLPESPRRLVAVGKVEEAKSALRKVYGSSVTEVFIEREVRLINDDINTSRSGSFRDFLHKDNFMPLIIGKFYLFLPAFS